MRRQTPRPREDHSRLRYQDQADAIGLRFLFARNGSKPRRSRRRHRLGYKATGFRGFIGRQYAQRRAAELPAPWLMPAAVADGMGICPIHSQALLVLGDLQDPGVNGDFTSGQAKALIILSS